MRTPPAAPSAGLRRALLPLLALGLAITAPAGLGCKGCLGGDPEATEEVNSDPFGGKRPKGGKALSKADLKARREKMKAKMGGGRAGLTMSVTRAEEPDRPTADAVKAARALVQGGDAGKAAEARAQLDPWLAQNPTDVDGWYWLGRAWTVESVSGQAIPAYTKALELDPGFQRARQWLALTQWKAGDCASALVHLNLLVEATPELPAAYLDRSVCHVAQRDFDAAMADTQKACALGDEGGCAQTKRLELRKTRGSKLGKLRGSGGPGGRAGTGAGPDDGAAPAEGTTAPGSPASGSPASGSPASGSPAPDPADGGAPTP